MAEGVILDGSEETTSLASKETGGGIDLDLVDDEELGKQVELHAISLEDGGKSPALAEKLAEKYVGMAPEKVADSNMKPDKQGPPDLCTVFEEHQEYKIIRTNLDTITRLISSTLEVVEVSAGEADRSEVRSALLPIASRWKEVGIELKVKLADLDTVQAAHHHNSPEDCLRDAVSQWLQKVVHAILVDSGGKYRTLAERLADKHQSFEECQECKIIRTNLDRITRLISSDPSAGLAWFAQKLEEKAFIANAADAVVLGYTSYQQTSRLMSAVKGKISTSQEAAREFSKFIEILESNPQSMDLARELCVEYGKQPITKSDKQTPDGPNTTTTGNGSKRAPHIHPEVTITKRNYQMIRKKFASLLRIASNRLQTKGISIEDLLLFLEAQYSLEDSNDGSDFVAAVTESSLTIGGIFRAIGKQHLWTYWNYFLLQSLVEEFANDDKDLRASITQYGEELTGFFFTTTIESYLKEVVRSSHPDSEQPPSPCPDSKLLSHLSVKFGRDITNRSLEYIRQLWESLGKKCRLPLHTILLQSIKEGSICVTWMIPSHLMPQLVKGLCKSAAYFKEQHILWASVDPVYLYKEPGAQLSDFPSQEYERVCSVGRIALFAAAEHGNSEIVDLLLSQSLNPNMLNKDNKTALDVAAEHDQWEMIGLLMASGAMSGEGMPEMLNEACRSGDVDAVTANLTNGVNVDSRNESDKTPLMVAAEHGRKEVAQLLLTHQAKINAIDKDNKTALDVAVEHEQWEVVELLVERGAISGEGKASRDGGSDGVIALLSNVLNVDSKDEGGITALIHASANGHTQRVEDLLKAGANPDLQTDIGATALMIASVSGHTQIVESLLKAGTNPDLQNYDGGTALMVASGKGHTQAVDRLLKAGANADLQNKNGDTALSVASQNSHSWIVDSLLKAGAKPDLQNNEGVTALIVASQNGPSQIVDSLLKAGAKPDLQENDGVTALILASQEGHTQIVDNLLKAGANPDVQNNKSETALIAASINGHTLVVESLLKAGAKPDLPMNEGGTALMVACVKGHTQVVESLLKAGAKRDVRVKYGGYTALMLASDKGDTHIVEILLKAGANPDLQNKDGSAALMAASLNGHTQIVESLLRAGANPDLRHNDGNTALTLACFTETIHIIRFLLKAGANPNHVTMVGKCPLLIAVRKGNKEMAQELISADANTNYIAEDGFNALMLSCSEGDLEMVDLLLSSSADPNLKQPQTGYTALMLAAKAGHMQIVQKLVSCGANLDDSDKDGMTAADIACANSQSEVHQELLNSGAHQGSLIEPQAPAKREDVVGELLKAFLKRMDKKSLLELKSILGDIRSDAPIKGLREIVHARPTDLVYEIPS